MAEMTYLQAISDGLRGEMRRHGYEIPTELTAALADRGLQRTGPP